MKGLAQTMFLFGLLCSTAAVIAPREAVPGASGAGVNDVKVVPQSTCVHGTYPCSPSTHVCVHALVDFGSRSNCY